MSFVHTWLEILVQMRTSYTNALAIDEIRLWVISDLQENYKKCMNIHELLCICVYGGSQVTIEGLRSKVG